MSLILDGSISTEEMVVNPLIKAFIAGHSGSGKTQCSMTLPGRKLLIDIDNRAETVAGWPETRFIPCHHPDPRSVEPWNKLVKIQAAIVNDVNKGDFPFESIIYDGATMMGRYSMNWALMLDSHRGLGGAPARQHYLPQMDVMARFIIGTLSVPRNILWTGHVELFADDEGGPQIFLPKITGKLRTEISNWFNETYLCFRIEGKEGEREYKWMTGGDGRYEFFKSSMNSLGRYWKDPIPLDFNQKVVGFEDLLKRRFGNDFKSERFESGVKDEAEAEAEGPVEESQS